MWSHYQRTIEGIEMNKTTEALKLAEEALEELHYSSGTVKAVTLYKSALVAIREVLAEQEKQEPVAFRTLELRIEPIAYGVKNTDEFLIFQNEQQAQHYADQWGFVVTPICGADAKAIRAEALEEAAKVCEEQPRHSGDATTFYVATGQCAAAIRGLK